MSMKQAAEELLKIADDIEQEAQEVTNFVCAECNHTATLATINQSRRTAAEQIDENVRVADITVNDEIACPACDGVMSYQASDESEKYYIDTKQADEKEADKTASEPIDYDSLQRYTQAE